MHEIRDGWGPQEPLRGLLGMDVPWRFWSPEVIRAIRGARCAMPPLPAPTASLYQRIEAWGPLLPLFHYHLGWPRVDFGLARWAAMDFEPLGDPTLSFIKRQWGPGLASFVLWSAELSGAPDPMPLPIAVMTKLRRMAASESIADVRGLHLENHWSLEAAGHWSGPVSSSMDDRVDDFFERRDLGAGEHELVVPLYRGWYRILTQVGNSLPSLSSGRSSRIHLTIAPIGYLGEFRKSRESARWFTGRHKAHALGLGNPSSTVSNS